MSEINEKIMSEFLELLKKVNAIEMQLHNFTREHSELMSKCTNIAQGVQNSLDERFNRQNNVVREANVNLVNQVNSTINRINDVVAIAVNNYCREKVKQDESRFNDYFQMQQAMEEKINKVFKTLSLFTRFFNEASKLEKAEELKNPLLNELLADHELTNRSIRCLQSVGILTIGDLIKCSRMNLYSITNFGRTSLREIEQFLEKKGLTLCKEPKL